MDPDRGGLDCVQEAQSQQVGSKPEEVVSDAVRVKVKAVVNVGKIEMEMLRNLPEIRSIEPLAIFKVRFYCSSPLACRVFAYQFL